MFASEDDEARMAVAVEGGAPVDVVRAYEELGPPRDSSLLTMQGLASTNGLLDEGPRAWTGIAELAREAADHTHMHVGPATRWLAPLDVAALRDFLAFEDHVKRGATRRGGDVPDYWYEAPVYYKGNPRAIIGPDAECPWPPYTERLDFELELALVVGVAGRDVAREDAGRHIFGFTILDDFSARDIQAREMSAWLGPAKGKDFATALGPCIVTADELGAEPDLEMICRVNGDEWGRARSSEMHWSWAEIVAHASMGEAIAPGDVFGSGTPGGCCGLDLGREVVAGDVVELEIEGIGVLRNVIGAPRRV